jgi:hypothetical protein
VVQKIRALSARDRTILLGVFVLCIFGVIFNDVFSSEEEYVFDESLAKETGTVIKDGYIIHRGAEWADTFEGLEMAVHSVSLTTDKDSGSGIAYVWITLDNQGKDSFTTTLSRPIATSAISTNSSIGGTIDAGEFQEDDLEFSLFENDIKAMKSFGFTFDVTNRSTMETRTFNAELSFE